MEGYRRPRTNKSLGDTFFCSGCGETNKKLFLHIETYRDDRSTRGHGIRIYQCKTCGEQFTQFGRYDGGAEGGFVVREDPMALIDGWRLMSDEDENEDEEEEEVA